MQHPYGPMPSIVYVRAPCPTCGATSLENTTGVCKQGQVMSGEYECPNDSEIDAEGFVTVPTAESLAAQADWINKVMTWEDARETASAE